MVKVATESLSFLSCQAYRLNYIQSSGRFLSSVVQAFIASYKRIKDFFSYIFSHIVK